MEDSLLASEQDGISQEESVKIMTVHAAKGLEWSVVFLPALEEGIFPSERSAMSGSGAALEEERRLFYVACTRAKERLYLSSAGYRMKFGRTSRCCPHGILPRSRGSCNRRRTGQQELMLPGKAILPKRS